MKKLYILFAVVAAAILGAAFSQLAGSGFGQALFCDDPLINEGGSCGCPDDGMMVVKNDRVYCLETPTPVDDEYLGDKKQLLIDCNRFPMLC